MANRGLEDCEEGKILEDGEIADDDDDDGPIAEAITTTATQPPKDEKENKESNQFNRFETFASYFPPGRDEYVKPHKRRKRGNSKKGKRMNNTQHNSGVESKKKFRPNEAALVTNHELVDVSQQLNDTSFDSIELPDENEYHFDQLDFDVLMEILGCTADKTLLDKITASEKPKIMVRIMKIMKKTHGNDKATERRFARLKRRTRDKSQNGCNSANNGGGGGAGPPKFKANCKFYLEGKCHKGADCHYSHDCPVPKRRELCKFYLQGFCGKGEDCLFMHGEFPCKFFHTNTECYAGEKCRFSHAPLTEDKREILRNYLDSGTLPDDPKPFRTHYSSDWSNSNKNEDYNDFDSSEIDSSFNYETEQLLSKPRPVIVGEPTPKMKTSYDTWKWQQELKELEKSYTGLKKNLFCIDDMFAINEKPPSPRIEDDEEEIEAQIQNYYNDMLDTDEYDEMIALQEIEEHQRKVKEEEEAQKCRNDLQQPPPPAQQMNSMSEEISEEEKRLIEASAHDEDLRILPQSMIPPPGGPFGPMPTIVPPFESNNYNPNNFSYGPPNSDPFHQFKPNPFQQPEHTECDPMSVAPFAQSPPDINTDVASIVRQIRNDSMQPEVKPPNSSPPTKPEYRDPRLNRVKEARPAPSPVATISSPTNVFEDKSNKPFIKVCNPNVIIDYKLVYMKIPKLNYSAYYELFQNDGAIKNDPRLKKYFSQANLADSQSPDFYPKSSLLSSHPLSSIPPISKLPPIIQPPLPSKILSPMDLITSSNSSSSKPEAESNTNNSSLLPPTTSRDPRMRSKDIDFRSNDTDGNDKSKPSDTTDKTEGNENSNSDNTLATTSTTVSNDLSSIPSYAIAALPISSSLYTTVVNNILAKSNDESNSISESKQSTSSLNGSLSKEEEDDDDDDCRLTIETEEKDMLKIWPSINANSTIDSDNEMEIDLQQQDNESGDESENENELIIACSEDDNKDCDNSTGSDSLPISNYSINC